METLSDKYTTMVFDSQTAFNYQYNIAQSNWDTYRHAMFRESRCLYYMQTLTAVSTFRDDDLDFGIIPYPKLNEEQENYNSLVSVYHAHFVMVPTFMEDEDRTGAIVEALAYYGKQLLTPAYFEIALKTKYAESPEDSKMYDLILNSVKYSFGYCYSTVCLAELGSLFRIMSRDVAKTYEERAETYEQKLQDLIDGLDEAAFKAQYGG